MRTILILAIVPACLLIAACQSLQGRISEKEDLLAAAGFDVKPANTPKREAELKSLPPGKFVSRAKDDHVEYLYADPVVCNCLYIGDQTAFNKYKSEVFQRQLADEQQVTAEMYQEPPAFWAGWSWGPWGWAAPGWWY
jgi:hypothetical protein